MLTLTPERVVIVLDELHQLKLLTLKLRMNKLLEKADTLMKAVKISHITFSSEEES